jgi:hypothetical protein
LSKSPSPAAYTSYCIRSTRHFMACIFNCQQRNRRKFEQLAAGMPDQVFRFPSSLRWLYPASVYVCMLEMSGTHACSHASYERSSNKGSGPMTPSYIKHRSLPCLFSGYQTGRKLAWLLGSRGGCLQRNAEPIASSQHIHTISAFCVKL